MPKVVHSDERNLILRVLQMCEMEKREGWKFPRDQALKRAAFLTGKSESFLSKLKQEKGGKTPDENLSTPGKRRRGKKKIIVDDMDKCILRRKVHEIYDIKKEVPTLKKILAAAKGEEENQEHRPQQDFHFQGGRETLRKILIDIGFKFKKM